MRIFLNFCPNKNLPFPSHIPPLKASTDFFTVKKIDWIPSSEKHKREKNPPPFPTISLPVYLDIEDPLLLGMFAWKDCRSILSATTSTKPDSLLTQKEKHI